MPCNLPQTRSLAHCSIWLALPILVCIRPGTWPLTLAAMHAVRFYPAGTLSLPVYPALNLALNRFSLIAGGGRGHHSRPGHPAAFASHSWVSAWQLALDSLQLQRDLPSTSCQV